MTQVKPFRWERAALLEAYSRMLEMRYLEERCDQLFRIGTVRGSVHLGIGQEAVAVGARLGLRDGDLVAPTYRNHNYAVAWGIPLDELFGELLGRETGSSGGRGGSKHIGSKQHDVLPGNAIVAAGLPIAAGVALSLQLDASSAVCLAVFGDGAMNQGVFHETLNLASIWNLPVIFLCENNLYSEMTPISAMVHISDLSVRASSYGIPSSIVDGMVVAEVADAIESAAARARAGGGPSFIEAKTYRFCGHMSGDKEPYRSQDEVERWRARDPISLLGATLAGMGIAEGVLREREEGARMAIDTATEAAIVAATAVPASIGSGTASWMEVKR